MTKSVVIVGAGPAGLLTAINLLRLNYNEETGTDTKHLEKPRYKITLIDPNVNLGLLTEEDLSNRYRSWMIGLSHQGLEAIKDVPGLFEKYISSKKLDLDIFYVHFSNRAYAELSNTNNKMHKECIVDRNYIVAALARYINDTFKNNFEAFYQCRALFVDSERQCIVAKDLSKDEELKFSYDLLIGCDGVRSIVRGAFIQAHRTFEMSVTEIFNEFKSIHLERHDSLKQNEFHILPKTVPNMFGVAIPEIGNKINIAMGYAPHQRCDKEMLSEDIETLIDYFQRHFKCLPIKDFRELANEWKAQTWNSTGQVHCNFYHSLKLNCIIMGDAAHATSPMLGMGMNTALGDAYELYLLIKKYNHDLSKVLPAFSKERVKEGNSLTDLSYYLTAIDTTVQIRYEVIDILRSFFCKFFPKGFIYESPSSLVG